MLILNVEYEDKRVKILYDDLNDVIGSKGLMQKKIGVEMTRALKKRFNQILSFSSFSALFQSGLGKIEALSGNFKGLYSMTVSANYRLILRPLSDDLSPERLKQCDTVFIEGVVDYHGKGSKNNWIIP